MATILHIDYEYPPCLGSTWLFFFLMFYSLCEPIFIPCLDCKYTFYIWGIYHKGRRILLELKGGIWNLASEDLGKRKAETSIYWVRTPRCQQCPSSGVQQWSQQSLYKQVSKQDSTNTSGMINAGWEAESDGERLLFQKGLTHPYLKKADIWDKNILVGGNSKFKCPKNRVCSSSFPLFRTPPWSFIFASLFLHL